VSSKTAITSLCMAIAKPLKERVTVHSLFGRPDSRGWSLKVRERPSKVRVMSPIRRVLDISKGLSDKSCALSDSKWEERLKGVV
jgi:hypothetical protein